MREADEDLQDEGWADGGVQGAHAVQHCMAGLQLRQQGGIGVREDLVVLLAPLLAQVEDALHWRLQLGACQALVHLVGTRSVCTIVSRCLWISGLDRPCQNMDKNKTGQQSASMKASRRSVRVHFDFPEVPS